MNSKRALLAFVRRLALIDLETIDSNDEEHETLSDIIAEAQGLMRTAARK